MVTYAFTYSERLFLKRVGPTFHVQKYRIIPDISNKCYSNKCYSVLVQNVACLGVAMVVAMKVSREMFQVESRARFSKTWKGDRLDI